MSYVFQDLRKSLSDDEVALGSKYIVREVLGTYVALRFSKSLILTFISVERLLL